MKNANLDGVAFKKVTLAEVDLSAVQNFRRRARMRV